MVFTRRICRGDSVYVYRVSTYREDGKVKQNSQYMGKEVKKGEKKIIIPPKHKCFAVRKILSYGATVSLYNQAKEFGLIKLMDDIFSEHVKINQIGKKIVILAINKILRDDSINNINKWFASTSLIKNTGLTSEDFNPKKLRHIISLLSSEVPDYFAEIEKSIFDKITEKYEKEPTMLVYDLSAITFYGNSNDLAKYGHDYTKNGCKKQINIVLAITKTLKFPIHHRILFGNILSVSTIDRLVAELKSFNAKNIIMILDRGFYSKRNIDELNPEYKVIGSLPSNLSIYKQALSKSIHIETSNNFFRYKNQIFFYKIHIIDGLNVFVFHSAKKYSNDLEDFLYELCIIEEELKKIQKEKFKIKKDVICELENVCDKYYKYFKFDYKRGWAFDFSINKKKLDIRKKSFGKIVLFTTIPLKEINEKEMLKLYREKDVVEKAFELMKGKGLQPIKTKTKNSTKSYAKLVVIGYLLLMLLKNKIDDENVSIKKIINHLKQVKEVLYQDGTTVVADINKQQREIMEKLGMV